MLNLRLKYVVLSSLFYGMLYAVPKANYMIKHREKYSDEESFAFAKKIIDHMRRRARTTTEIYGVENLPKENGFIMYSNHQGKYDALGILLSMDRPCGVLWEKKQASRLLSRQICGLIGAVQIDLEDTKEKLKAILEVTKKVQAGKNMLVFPEGGYGDNKNNLQEFQSGCFHCSLHSKTPIVPVVIYDSYKAMNSNTFERVTTQVHFLPAIFPEEYAGMTKKQLCDVVRERISEKLNEIQNGHL